MIRTSDPLLPKQLRYQAALHPELGDCTDRQAAAGAGSASWRETSMHWRMCCSQTYFNAEKVNSADTAWPASGTYLAACCVVRRTPTILSTCMTISRVISRPISRLPPAEIAL